MKNPFGWKTMRCCAHTGPCPRTSRCVCVSCSTQNRRNEKRYIYNKWEMISRYIVASKSVRAASINYDWSVIWRQFSCLVWTASSVCNRSDRFRVPYDLCHSSASRTWWHASSFVFFSRIDTQSTSLRASFVYVESQRNLSFLCESASLVRSSLF